MKTYIATDAEAKGLHDGSVRGIVVPCKPKHPGGIITGPSAEPGGVIEAYGGGKWSNPSRMEVTKAPYAVGDVVGVKEAWTWTGHGEDCIYRADPYDGPFKVPEQRWQSAESMPDWAIRTRVVILAVEARNDNGEWVWVYTVERSKE